MAELIAHGSRPEDQRRWTLRDGSEMTLGRAEAKCDLAVPWDRMISGVHALLSWAGGKLRVRRLQKSINPVFFAGTDQGFEEFEVSPGQTFSVATTSFILQEDDGNQPAVAPVVRVDTPDFQSSATLAT